MKELKKYLMCVRTLEFNVRTGPKSSTGVTFNIFLLFIITNAIVMIDNKKIFNGTPLEDLGPVRTLNSNVRTHIKYFLILS